MNANKRVIIDVLILLVFAIPLVYFKKFGKPYKRGFFCNDQSLMHPFKESTIKNWMLYFIGLVIPLCVIIIVELVLSQKEESEESEPYVVLGMEIPGWLVQCYKKIGIFAFGAAVAQLATDIAKYSIGRLRPHFIAVCQPIIDGAPCDETMEGSKYIEEFKCSAQGTSDRMLKEMRLSFPSGHSSFTFYTMVYITFYLQSRMTYKGSTLLRHFLQFLLIMMAWFTGLSRISDYKHHWFDVLAGSLLGSIVAIIMAVYVSDLFTSKKLDLP